jgi:hypothetical protein
MQGNELYQHILGLTSPWTVRDVNLDTENQRLRSFRYYEDQMEETREVWLLAPNRNWSSLEISGDMHAVSGMKMLASSNGAVSLLPPA